MSQEQTFSDSERIICCHSNALQSAAIINTEVSYTHEYGIIIMMG